MLKLLNRHGHVESLMVRNSVVAMCIGGHCTQSSYIQYFCMILTKQKLGILRSAPYNIRV